MLKKEINTT